MPLFSNFVEVLTSANRRNWLTLYTLRSTLRVENKALIFNINKGR